MAFNLRQTIDELQEQFLEEDNKRPWIIAFSGGKDSTTLLQLVWTAIQELPAELRSQCRDVYVICNNTLVENPQVLRFVDKQLKAIREAAADQSMPFTVDQTTPRLEDTFWINLIGKGYPAPNSTFRWCTERLKISPTSRYIQEKISGYGEAIILLGTRSDESATRAGSMKKHEVSGSRLRNHPLPNAKAYAPIKDMTTDEVWMYLQQNKSPWTGKRNRELITLYKNGSGGDCPLVVDIKTPSCGNSRFGCWVCTVVKRDRSMEALIDNGEDWMVPLMKIRDFLAATIDRSRPDYDPHEYRMPIRRNLQDGIGPYWPKVRKYILEQILKAQKVAQQEDEDIRLISYQELVGIQVQWHRDFIFEYSVSDIYNSVYGKTLDIASPGENYQTEKRLLDEACEEHPDDVNLISNLLRAQRNKTLLVKKYGLQNDLEAILEEHVDPKFTPYYHANQTGNATEL